MNTERFLTVEEIAAMLQHQPRSIRRDIREGKLRAHRIGNAYRIAPEDYQIYLKNTETRPREEEEGKLPVAC